MLRRLGGRLGSRLSTKLRTIRGQLELLAVTLAGAVALALLLLFFRGFFEGLVREKYATPSEADFALAKSVLDGGDAKEIDPLYRIWMRHDPIVGIERLPALLAARAGERCRDRVRRTLVGGSPAQRRRAGEFALASGDAAHVAALQFAARRARSVGEEALARDLDATATTLAGSDRGCHNEEGG